ncbi:hypothetical protein E2C01_045775 [Portunus trituberculatus]|uniref:Uncharacterized protein n=1 Tax=Portunus trituberculatus TaxID=210409 RepID=A0A5B7G416_PORTR|nr:hypothetical protein [Portunus trituberculatus]
MQENVFLVTTAAQVTTGGGRKGTPGSLCLQPVKSSVYESSKTNILQETTKSCLAALRMAVVDRRIVCGGGCLEAWAATTVTHLITTNAQLLTQLAGASPYHIFKSKTIVPKEKDRHHADKTSLSSSQGKATTGVGA